MAYGTKDAKIPNGKSSDGGGERKERTTNGVAMGKADATGERKNGSKEMGEYNTGRSESVCYTHKKEGY